MAGIEGREQAASELVMYNRYHRFAERRRVGKKDCRIGQVHTFLGETGVGGQKSAAGKGARSTCFVVQSFLGADIGLR